MKTNAKLMLLMDHWPSTSIPKGTRPFVAGGRSLSLKGHAVWHKKKERGSAIQAINMERARARANRKK